MESRYASTDWAGGPGVAPQADVAFLASQRWRHGDPDPVLEMRETPDGPAVLAFSSLDALVDGCGPAQPWIAFGVSRLGEVLDACGGALLLWDVVLDPQQRHLEESR